MKINEIEKLTKEILMENTATREDDFRLYVWVLYKMGVNLNTSLRDFFWHAKEKGYPALESVSRARRKIFEDYPELQPLKTKLNREKKEREYINYSRGGK